MMDKIHLKNHIIYNTALLFIKQGYTKTTTKQIALNCNITEGALFRSFKDKESILKEIINIILTNNLLNINNINDYLNLSINILYNANKDEILNDLFINIYSLDNTRKLLNEYIAELFYRNLNLLNYDVKEYYELEVALSGIFLNYLKLETNMYFTINQKINRYIDIVKMLLNNTQYSASNTNINILDYINNYFIKKGDNN